MQKQYITPLVVCLTILCGCATTSLTNQFTSAGEGLQNPYYLPKTDGRPYPNSVIMELDTGLGSVPNTPYFKIFVINNSIKVRKIKQGKAFIVDLYYEYNRGGAVKIGNDVAWRRVDSIIYLCEQQFKSKPVATLGTVYATSFTDGKILKEQKFDVNESNLEGSLRQLSYFEKEFYNAACK